MKTRRNFSLAHQRVLTLGLWVLVVASIVTALFQVAIAWQIPMVLLALILIITLLNPVEEIRTNVRYLRNVKETAAPSRTFATQQEFYTDLGQAVERAQSTLDLTHIRDHAPVSFGQAAEEYTENVTEWLKKDKNHSARRIISVRTPEMMSWAKRLAKLQQSHPGYHVRVVDWSIRAPALNLAIVDNNAVFLALSGETVERMRGFAIEDETTSDYFSHYYDVLWNSAVDLSEYLEKQQSG